MTEEHANKTPTDFISQSTVWKFKECEIDLKHPKKEEKFTHQVQNN